MAYKPKPKPVRTHVNCIHCGKELTEYELFFGMCACQPIVNSQGKPYSKNDNGGQTNTDPLNELP